MLIACAVFLVSAADVSVLVCGNFNSDCSDALNRMAADNWLIINDSFARDLARLVGDHSLRLYIGPGASTLKWDLLPNRPITISPVSHAMPGSYFPIGFDFGDSLNIILPQQDISFGHPLDSISSPGAPQITIITAKSKPRIHMNRFTVRIGSLISPSAPEFYVNELAASYPLLHDQAITFVIRDFVHSVDELSHSCTLSPFRSQDDASPLFYLPHLAETGVIFNFDANRVVRVTGGSQTQELTIQLSVPERMTLSYDHLSALNEFRLNDKSVRSHSQLPRIHIRANQESVISFEGFSPLDGFPFATIDSQSSFVTVTSTSAIPAQFTSGSKINIIYRSLCDMKPSQYSGCDLMIGTGASDLRTLNVGDGQITLTGSDLSRSVTLKGSQFTILNTLAGKHLLTMTYSATSHPANLDVNFGDFGKILLDDSWANCRHQILRLNSIPGHCTYAFHRSAVSLSSISSVVEVVDALYPISKACLAVSENDRCSTISQLVFPQVLDAYFAGSSSATLEVAGTLFELDVGFLSSRDVTITGGNGRPSINLTADRDIELKTNVKIDGVDLVITPRRLVTISGEKFVITRSTVFGSKVVLKCIWGVGGVFADEPTQSPQPTPSLPPTHEPGSNKLAIILGTTIPVALLILGIAGYCIDKKLRKSKYHRMGDVDFSAEGLDLTTQKTFTETGRGE
jgi:hypothetical protein